MRGVGCPSYSRFMGTRDLSETGILALAQIEVYDASWFPGSIAVLHDAQQSIIRGATIEKLLRFGFLEETPDPVAREVLRITEAGHTALHDRLDVHNQVRQQRQMQEDLARTGLRVEFGGANSPKNRLRKPTKAD